MGLGATVVTSEVMAMVAAEVAEATVVLMVATLAAAVALEEEMVEVGMGEMVALEAVEEATSMVRRRRLLQDSVFATGQGGLS